MRLYLFIPETEFPEKGILPAIIVVDIWNDRSDSTAEVFSQTAEGGESRWNFCTQLVLVRIYIWIILVWFDI